MTGADLDWNEITVPVELPEVVDEVFNATDNLVLIESYLPGREFCVSVGGPVSTTMTASKLARCQ